MILKVYEFLHFQNLTAKHRHVVVPTNYFLRKNPGFIK
ncbi:hypothetical protein LEP1GSC073_0816 [Leptospira noguchii str. Cascata]|nr:hypothetical protein LEP1GSC073_0816 [Leptospira noguchii str. Cascata]